MSYRKLKKEEMTVNLEEGKDGELLVIVGMYEKDNWQQHVVIRLINFPDNCTSLDYFKNFTISGVKS
jgi:hypothetical protein